MTKPDASAQIRLDARSLRGLAHPIRLRLLGRLREDGPSTATALAADIGESSGTTSYHLRQLAAYGFIEPDDTERTNRKERWWRASHRATVLEPINDGNPETDLLVDEYLRSIAQAYSERLVRFVDTLPSVRESLGTEWAEVGDLSDWGLVLTPEQAAALRDSLHEIIGAQPGHDPLVPLPPGAARVIVQLQVMPTLSRSAS